MATFGVRIPRTMLAQVDRLAAEDERSRAYIVRKALTNYLAEAAA